MAQGYHLHNIKFGKARTGANLKEKASSVDE